MKKKILYVIGSLGVGGAERQMSLLARGCRASGSEVHVFAFSATATSIRKELEGAGIVIHDGKVGSKLKSPLLRKPMTLFQLGRAFLSLLKLGFVLRPDVIQSFLYLSNFVGSLAGKFLRTPVVIVSLRGLASHQDHVKISYFMDFLSCRWADLIIANSNAVAEDMIFRVGADRRKFRVIYNGLREEFLQEPSDSPYSFKPKVAIGCVANLIPYKGHEELICAFANAFKDHQEIILLLAGEDRGIGQRLKNLCEDKGVSEQVQFLGRCDQVPEFLSSLDIGVLSSHEEGFPNAVIEMVAMGLPVVGTDVGGVREALTGFPDCTVIPSKDISAMSQALIQIRANLSEIKQRNPIRKELARANYSSQKMVERYEGLYG